MDSPEVGRTKEADPDAITVTLFRCAKGRVRGWYIGPVLQLHDGGHALYASRSRNLPGPLAIKRALDLARQLGLRVSLADPDGLWDSMLGGE